MGVAMLATHIITGVSKAAFVRASSTCLASLSKEHYVVKLEHSGAGQSMAVDYDAREWHRYGSEQPGTLKGRAMSIDGDHFIAVHHVLPST